MALEFSKSNEKKTLKGNLRGKMFGALTALQILAAGVPGISVPANAQNSSTESFSGNQIRDPLAEGLRKQGQEMLRKELGDKPKQLRAKMQELLALGPTCHEEVDRSMLRNMPGAKGIYEKLVETFASYNDYMSALSDDFSRLPIPVDPAPPADTEFGFDFDSSWSFELEPGMTKEQFEETIRTLRSFEQGIERGVSEIMNYPNAPQLIKLLLQESNCAVS